MRRLLIFKNFKLSNEVDKIFLENIGRYKLEKKQTIFNFNIYYNILKKDPFFFKNTLLYPRLP